MSGFLGSEPLWYRRLAVFEPQRQSREVHGRLQASIGLRRQWRATGCLSRDGSRLPSQPENMAICSDLRDRTASGFACGTSAGLEPATSRVTGRSWRLRVERGWAGIPTESGLSDADVAGKSV